MATQGTHMPNFNSDALKPYNLSSSLPNMLNTEEFSVSKSMAGLNNGSVCVDGRSTKISKRRSRASKKVPTTVFRTDASNFRAMVEHFTGLPITSFDSHANNFILPRPLPRRAVGNEQITPTFGILDTSTLSSVFNSNQVPGFVDLQSHMRGSYYFRPPCEGAAAAASQGHLMADMNLPNPGWHELHAPAFSASF
ncbi:hypothetical protein SUGI_0815200 [Cryptomeria japonica]|uniref:uncharacterized protein LOC131857452 n=1 Tax=Cryptomeria japonica TaxID=3369 RepID=UPI00241485D2|nr:uncharacterized protein LOC131857452 [Cryptomeria japonica]GLJ39864.1 hypothetical protein SUGI_0815200 [Cryptomeria japonica]